jgi:hypothetical protein
LDAEETGRKDALVRELERLLLYEEVS